MILLAAPAWSQVTLDLNALDTPQVARPKPRAPTPKLVPAPSKPTPPPAVTAAPPPPVRLAPDATPAPAPVATIAPPVAPTSVTRTASLATGLRVLFDADQSDLSTDSDTQIGALADRVKANATATVDVRSYAAGKPDDPSSARRVSLARALAIRAALVARGVESARIYVRALGTGDAPTDRADVTVSGADPTLKTEP